MEHGRCTEKTDLYEKASRVMDGAWTVGAEHIHPGQQAFQKGMCRSRQQGSLSFHDSPPDKHLIKGSNIEKLADEILSIIKK